MPRESKLIVAARVNLEKGGTMGIQTHLDKFHDKIKLVV